MSETWRRIHTWDADPTFNMGLDEALLNAVGSPDVALRFYTWRPDALSLGYFQRVSDVGGRHTASTIVRRMTGGGAIHHTAELTYSLAAPDSHALFRGPVTASYERIHAVLADVLGALGVSATLRRATPLDSDQSGTGMCFHKSSPLDLIWQGAKGVGSAQRRTGGRVLHHGSIKLAPSELETGVATLADAGVERTPAELAAELEQAFAAEFQCTLEPSIPTDAELEHAYLRGPFFGSPEFVARR